MLGNMDAGAGDGNMDAGAGDGTDGLWTVIQRKCGKGSVTGCGVRG